LLGSGAAPQALGHVFGQLEELRRGLSVAEELALVAGLRVGLALVESVALLTLQQRRALLGIDVAAPYDDDAPANPLVAFAAPAFGEQVELAPAPGPVEPVQ
jgi:hypothetical protein